MSTQGSGDAFGPGSSPSGSSPASAGLAASHSIPIAALAAAVVAAARELIMWPPDDERPGPDDDHDAWFTDGEMRRYNALRDAIFLLDGRPL